MPERRFYLFNNIDKYKMCKIVENIIIEKAGRKK